MDEKPLLTKPKGAKSLLWVHFGFEVTEKGEYINPKVVRCRICTAANVGYSGNTSNLKQHLTLYHPENLPGPSGVGQLGPKQVTLEKLSTLPKDKLPAGSKRSRDITTALA